MKKSIQKRFQNSLQWKLTLLITLLVNPASGIKSGNPVYQGDISDKEHYCHCSSHSPWKYLYLFSHRQGSKAPKKTYRGNLPHPGAESFRTIDCSRFR